MQKINNISSSNPLSNTPYWGDPNGNNLNAEYAAEWIVSYLEKMQLELPCPENGQSLWHAKEILKWQRHRIKSRRDQGVLGTGKPHIFVGEKLDDIA